MKLGKIIESDEILLRAPTGNDLAGNWYRWLNDSTVTRYQNKGHYLNTRKKQRDYFRSMLKSEGDLLFAIVDKYGNKHIGSAGLHKIDTHNRSAELGIVIGEKEYWGRGYGKIAWNMVAYYGFKALGLHRIQAIIFKGNEPSIRSALASGFKKEGVMQDIYLKKNKYHSAFIMAVIEKDFKKIINIKIR